MKGDKEKRVSALGAKLEWPDKETVMVDIGNEGKEEP